MTPVSLFTVHGSHSLYMCSCISFHHTPSHANALTLGCLATTRNITRNRCEFLQGTSRIVFMIPDKAPPAPTLSSSPRGGRKESRKFRRITVELPCWFSGDGPHEWTGTAVNLSRAGCAIRSTTPVQQGQCLRVLLFLSANQTPIEVREAPVRWAANEYFGLEFITLSIRDASRLQNLLTSLGT